MKIKFLIIISAIIVFALISFAMPNLSQVYGSCEGTQNGTLQFAIGYQWTNGLLYIDNAECTWKLFGVISIVSLLSEEISFQNFGIVQYAYAGCVATILPQPCFDSYVGSHEPMTQKSIMEDFARNIELNFGDWQMSDRKWDDTNTSLQLPAIICTEFVVDGIKQYRMAKWVDSYRISSFEDHKNDFLCNKWLAPIDDGIKVKWDKPNYFANDTGIIQVTDKDMNLDHNKIDSFVIHVWSDTDHTGIQLTVTEIDESSGIFESKVFFTIVDESSGTTLLVEDAVWAEHKSNVTFSRIIDGSETEPATDTFDRQDKLPWFFLIVAYWPVSITIIGIIVAIVIVVWRKKR